MIAQTILWLLEIVIKSKRISWTALKNPSVNIYVDGDVGRNFIKCILFDILSISKGFLSEHFERKGV